MNERSKAVIPDRNKIDLQYTDMWSEIMKDFQNYEKNIDLKKLMTEKTRWQRNSWI